MDPEIHQPSDPNTENREDGPLAPPDSTPIAPPEAQRGIRWVFFGPDGLRAGWSVLIFAAIFAVLLSCTILIASRFHHPNQGPIKEAAPGQMIIGEGVSVLFVVIAAFVVALIERRHILDYNLRGPRRPQHFIGGVLAGFGALSVLVGALVLGGWLHFAGFALSGPAIAKYAVLWGIGFFLVGCAEEGMFRCYLQFTLARGINFWWALGLNILMCADLAFRAKGNGVWGVYAMAIIGFFPCLALYLKSAPRSGFWYAAWVTSTLFGFVHTSNGGENPIGIFQAAFIGAVFCVSIRLTGSAWWAIGVHAGWDWGQSFFYSTPDSGLLVKGHLFNSSFAGNVLYSGGADGPEGSVLGIGVILLLLIFLIAVYGRRNTPAAASVEMAQL